MDPDLTTKDLLAYIERDRRVLEDVIAPLDDEGLAAPGHEGWSVKDHMAHIAAWERMFVAHIADGSDHEVAGMDRVTFVRSNADAVNESLYRLHRDDSVSTVRDDFAAAHREAVACIGALSSAQLDEPYSDDDPSMEPVRAEIAWNTYEHYIEHAVWIRELLESRPQTP